MKHIRQFLIRLWINGEQNYTLNIMCPAVPKMGKFFFHLFCLALSVLHFHFSLRRMPHPLTQRGNFDIKEKNQADSRVLVRDIGSWVCFSLICIHWPRRNFLGNLDKFSNIDWQLYVAIRYHIVLDENTRTWITYFMANFLSWYGIKKLHYYAARSHV